MQGLTLYELMGEDMSIEANLIDKNHVCVEVFDESEKIVYQEKSHMYAWESLVYFARQVLLLNAQLKIKLDEIDE